MIIPVYNAEKYIEQTLNCIYSQTMKASDIETIMFFDGCTDASIRIAKNWLANNSQNRNVKMIISDNNVGPSIARNTATEHATGEYIHFCDVDDLINQKFYECLYSAAKWANADVAVSCFVNERYPNNSIIFDEQYVITMPQDKINHTLVDTNGYPVRYIIRRKFWNDNKFIFPPDMQYCEDMLIITKMVVKSDKIVVVPNAFYFYKQRATSLLNARGKNKIRNYYWKIAKKSVNDFMDNNDLKPTTYRDKKIKFNLFNLLPIITAKISSDNSYLRFRLLGLIPILKISIKQKRRRYI